MSSTEPHVRAGGFDRRVASAVVLAGLRSLVKRLGFEGRTCGEPYSVRPTAAGGCIPLANTSEVSEFLARFQREKNRRPIVITGYE
eukprot:2758444-Alexandrium_andersonii.AAC.1